MGYPGPKEEGETGPLLGMQKTSVCLLQMARPTERVHLRTTAAPRTGSVTLSWVSEQFLM